MACNVRSLEGLWVDKRFHSVLRVEQPTFLPD